MQPLPDNAPQTDVFNEWAKVELMGHSEIAGHVTVQNVAAPMLRVDVPDAAGNILYSRLFNPAAIYSITPVAMQIAIGLAVKMDAKPISRFDLAKLAQQAPPMLPGIEQGQLDADPDEDLDYDKYHD